MPSYNYLVQKQAADALNQDANMDVGRCQNMQLLLTRYVPEEVIKPNQTYKVTNQRGKSEDKRYQDTWLENLIKRFDVRQNNRDWIRTQQAYCQRWDAMTINRARRFEGTLNSRLIVGLGGKGVLETGITLHHVTGLPYIPGSALKGMTRAYALFSIAAIEGLDVTQDGLLAEFETYLATANDNYERLKPDTYNYARLFRWAFGNTDTAGALVFYDGVLSGWESGVTYLFDIDIMNPHYPEYYGSKGATPPSDNDSPKPIKFITVAKGVRFAFGLGLRGGATYHEEAFNQIYTWMQAGLEEFGIGAKTRSGYGMFENLEDK